MKRNIRLIARLDIKGANLIKGIHLEGLRVIGTPSEYAQRYYQQGVDEIVYLDCVASLYGRNSLSNIIEMTAMNVFIPITVGGGIRSVEDARQILRSGADKVAVNTAAVANPQLISNIARRFGSQSMVLSIEAKRSGDSWQVYTDNGRERTNLDVVDWARRGVELGAGEILLTSVDQEGTRKGFDLKLVSAVAEAVPVPVIASGGMGTVSDAISVVNEGGAAAFAMADVLHYKRLTVGEVRYALKEAGLGVRNFEVS